MAIIIETCPKCGHDLHDLVIATYPPIPQKKCFNCGWEWTGEREEIIRVPFGGNALNIDDTYCMANNLNDSVYIMNTAKLDDIPKFSYDDIMAAIERTKKYIKH